MRVGLVILDGWGCNDAPQRDAVAAAATPTMDRLTRAGYATELAVSGRRVGLPTGQMGNSEVGHLTIGAGRVLTQAATKIGDAIDAGSFASTEAFQTAFDAVHDGGRVHIVGLVSDGGVHADIRHIRALIDAAATAGVEAVTHAITDGRDTDPHGGADFVAALAAHAETVGTGAVATVVGRYLAMDRDRNWDRTARAAAALTAAGAAPHTAATAEAAVQRAYDRGESDEFIAPTQVAGRPRIRAGDAVICANFRPDRMRQLVRMLCDIDPTWEGSYAPADLTVVTMTRYDARFTLPVAFAADRPATPLGAALAAAGRTQFRCAESEKYAHVTYFLNGGREAPFDGERRTIVDSPDVPTYDMAPAMAADTVTDVTVEAIRTDDPDVVVVNYANPDMVGHTGDFAAAVTAVEAVDAALDRLVAAMRDADAVVCVTADHGNADEMGPPDRPHTAHTTNRVPFVYLPAPDDVRPHVLGADRSLCDIAPTLLQAADVAVPATMTGEAIAHPVTDDAAG